MEQPFWHCSAGKDRAGFATILVLYLLDFKMEDIIEDYLSTNLFYQNSIQEFIKIVWSRVFKCVRSSVWSL